MTNAFAANPVDLMSARFHWSQVTAVFGGRFDPPHQGHLEAMEGILKNPGVRAVRVVPSAAPPHKAAVASAEDRLEMVRRLLESSSLGSRTADSPFTVDDRELVRFRTTGTLSYAFDTLEELRQLGIEPGFVIGTDAFAAIENWHRFPDLLRQGHWMILDRKETQKPGNPSPPSAQASAQATLQKLVGSGLLRPLPSQLSSPQTTGAPEWEVSGPEKRRLILLPTPARALSSTLIRESLARTGKAPEGTLPPAIDAYLSLRKLYGKAR